MPIPRGPRTLEVHVRLLLEKFRLLRDFRLRSLILAHPHCVLCVHRTLLRGCKSVCNLVAASQYKVTRSESRGRVKKIHASRCVPLSSHKTAYKKSVRFPSSRLYREFRFFLRPLLLPDRRASINRIVHNRSFIAHAQTASNEGCDSARIFALWKLSLTVDFFLIFIIYTHIYICIFCIK